MKNVKIMVEQFNPMQEEEAVPGGNDSQLNKQILKALQVMSKKENISVPFVREMVETIIEKITVKLEQLDVSLDYISAALLGQDAQDVGVRQKAAGRFMGRDQAEKAAGQGKPSKGI